MGESLSSVRHDSLDKGEVPPLRAPARRQHRDDDA